MRPIRILLFFLFLVTTSYLFAQTNKKDTVYYLVDTIKTPAKDRMVIVDIENPFKCYEIECRCLKYAKKPVFCYRIDKTRGEKIKKLKNINFIMLSDLTHLAQEGGGDLFNNNHVAFFIEPEGNHYIKHQVMLIKPQKDETVE